MSEYTVTHDDLGAFSELIERENHGYVYNSVIDELFPVDETTGLPSLPEGYFWKVYKQYDRPYVGLYFEEKTVIEPDRLTLFFNKNAKGTVKIKARKIEDYHIDQAIQDPVVGVFKTCQNLLQYLPKHLASEISPADYSPYYGTYPPKNIHTADGKLEE